jgi:hypothetical protein
MWHVLLDITLWLLFLVFLVSSLVNADEARLWKSRCESALAQLAADDTRALAAQHNLKESAPTVHAPNLKIRLVSTDWTHDDPLCPAVKHLTR